MKHRLFCGMAWASSPVTASGFWFRILGYGLHVSTKKRSEALFSERYGFRRAFYVLGLRFEVLRP